MVKINFDDVLLTILQILIILYSLPIFFISLLALPGVDFFGDPVPFWYGTGFGLIFLAIGLLMVGSQIWIFKLRKKGRLPKWAEYVIAFVGLWPLLFNTVTMPFVAKLFLK